MVFSRAIAKQKLQADQLSEQILIERIRLQQEKQILKQQLRATLGSPQGVAASFATGFSVSWLFHKRKKFLKLSELPWSTIITSASMYLASKD